MDGTHRLTFSKTTMAAVGIACLVPHWQAADEGARLSLDCAAQEHRQTEAGIGDLEAFETSAPGGPSIARTRIETVADRCGIRELHEQKNDGLVGGGVPRYDPVRKLWQ